MNKNDPFLPATPPTPPHIYAQVREFATEVVEYVLNELDGGFWNKKFAALSIEEKSAFFESIADGFNDEIE